jgi:ribosomal protein S18 acetylase RimI-like enzyme
MNKIEIRPLSADDHTAVCDLYCKSVKCNPNGFIQDIGFHGCLISRTREWREKGGDLLVGHVDDALVSLGALAPHSGSAVELCKLHVDPLWQGHGFGRQMTERLISAARMRGFSDVILHVTVTQKAAVNLYHSLGFEPVKQDLFQTQVFGKPVSFDTLHMRLSLGTARAQFSGETRNREQISAS